MEDGVDFNSSRNVFVAALILVIAIGVKYGADDNVSVGPIHFSGLALSALVGIILNFVFGIFCSRLMLASLSKFKFLRNRKLYGGAKIDE